MWPGDDGGWAVRPDGERGQRDLPAVRRRMVGVDQCVPVLDGRWVPYVNLDNAASTPAFRRVAVTVDRFLPHYASVHRGTGYLSRLSTAAYEEARAVVGRFVGADPDRDVVLFGRNTTEAVNRLARSLPVAPGSVVLTTMLEHHSSVDLAVAALQRLVAGEVAGTYRTIDDGTFAPEGYVEPAPFTLGGVADRRRGWARAGRAEALVGVGSA